MATFSPVRVCVPSLTFPKVPYPRVLPKFIYFENNFYQQHNGRLSD